MIIATKYVVYLLLVTFWYQGNPVYMFDEQFKSQLYPNTQPNDYQNFLWIL